MQAEEEAAKLAREEQVIARACNESRRDPRVGSGVFNLTGRVGSGRVRSGPVRSGRIGSGRVGSALLRLRDFQTSPVDSGFYDPTPEHPLVVTVVPRPLMSVPSLGLALWRGERPPLRVQRD